MTTFLRRYGPIFGVGLIIGVAVWLRFGFEPNAGSHRIAVEHVEAQSLEPAADTADFDSVEVTVQRPRGTPADPADVFAPRWLTAGNSVYRSQPDAGELVFGGQVSPITWVSWSSGDGGATIRVSVDGKLVERVESLGAGSGNVALEFGLSLPRSSLLLLAVAIGWSLPLAGLVLSQLRKITGGIDRRRLLVRSVGLIGVCMVVIQVWPIDPPAVVRYDVLVQPVVDQPSTSSPVELNVRIVDDDGRSRIPPSSEIDEGWRSTGESVVGDLGPPLRWIFVASPYDRLEIGATSASVAVDVLANGRHTEVVTNSGTSDPVSLTLAELGPPSAWSDRIALWGSRLGDLALVAVGLVLLAGLVAVRPGAHVDSEQPFTDQRPQVRRRRLVRAAYHARVAAGVWVAMLVVFWPGMMNPDSALQWISLDVGQLYDWHPYPMSIVLGVLRFIVDSPWLPISLVAMTAALLVGLAATWAEDTGAPTWCIRAVTWGPALAPVTSIMTVALWKDVVMGVGVLALVLVLWQTERSSGTWLQARRRNTVFAVVACLVIWLTRHNGWPIVVGSLALMAMLRPTARRSLLAVGTVTVVIALFVRVPLMRILDVEPSPVVAHNYMQRISAHVNAGTELEPDEQAYLSGLRPLDIPWPYDCRTVQTTWFGDDVIPWTDYVDDESKLRSLALKLAIRNPGVEIAHLKCSSRILWQITDQGTYTYFLDGYTHGGFVSTIPRFWEDLPLESHPSNSLAVDVFEGYVGLPSPLIRPAIYLYALLGAAALAAGRRRSLGPMLVVMPALVQTATLVPFGLVQDTRFQYGTVLVALVMAPILLADSMRSGPGQSPDQPRQAAQTEPDPERRVGEDAIGSA